MNRLIPVIALALSIAALAFSFGRKVSTTRSVPEAFQTERERLEERVRSLESSLDELDRKFEGLIQDQARLLSSGLAGVRAKGKDPRERGAKTKDGGKSRKDEDASSGEPIPEFAEKLGPMLADLEKKQATLEKNLQELGVFEHFESLREEVDEAYALVLDEKHSSEDRLKALSLLREAERIDDAVVESMVDLWDGSFGSEKQGVYTRWYISENLEGVSHPDFRDRLLTQLSAEPIAKLRIRAIDTLGPMLPDPLVEDMLLNLNKNDADPSVRARANEVYDRYLSELEKR